MSYADLVPEEYQHELLAIQDADRLSSFRIGDITNELTGLNSNYPTGQIYQAVASFCGKASRTVREYAQVARFYPIPERQTYEMLSFDHFRLAMRYGDKWRHALEWSVNQVEETNRPANIDRMEVHYSGNETALNYLPDNKPESYVGEIKGIIDRLNEITRLIEPKEQVVIRILLSARDKLMQILQIA